MQRNDRDPGTHKNTMLHVAKPLQNPTTDLQRVDAPLMRLHLSYALARLQAPDPHNTVTAAADDLHLKTKI